MPMPRLAKSHFGLKRTVLPADKLCCRNAKEHMENEVDQIAYAYGEKHVLRQERFGNRINFQRLGLP